MSEERKSWQDPEAILEDIGIEKGMTVADMGCGPGFFTLPIASAVGEEGLVYAVDSDPGALEMLRDRAMSDGTAKAIKAVRADVTETGIPARSVDVALFANVLHDIEDKGAFLAEVERICRPGAAVVDIDWKKAETGMGPPLEVRLAEAESRKILAANGLRVVKSIHPGPHHYGLLCSQSHPLPLAPTSYVIATYSNRTESNLPCLRGFRRSCVLPDSAAAGPQPKCRIACQQEPPMTLAARQ